MHKSRSVPRRIGHCSPFFSIKEKQVRFSATYIAFHRILWIENRKACKTPPVDVLPALHHSRILGGCRHPQHHLSIAVPARLKAPRLLRQDAAIDVELSVTSQAIQAEVISYTLFM